MDKFVNDELLGKKVFFINPHSVIQDELIDTIVDDEYEVYMINDYKKINDIKNIYNNSIVYINIDAGLSEAEWEKLIRFYSDDSLKKNIKIGILTYNEDQKLAHKYLMDILVPCGFIRLKLGLKESINIVKQTLEANEAKGKRKFVRASPQPDDGSFNWKNKDGTLMFGHINDISSVGMAITFDEEKDIEKNSILKDIQIKLKGTLIMVSGVVIGFRKEEESKTIYVLIFDRTLSRNMKKRLRMSIHKLLQDDINKKLKL